MERDLDLKPGLKIAGCVALIVAALVIIGPYLGYVIIYGYDSHRISKLRIGNVEFYGIVTDLKGTPLSDVDISAKLSVYNFIGGRRDIELKTTTDENGGFSVGPRKGISLQIYGFEKAGLEVRGRRWPQRGWQYWVFKFSPHSNEKFTPNANAPYVFTMEPRSGP